MSARLVLVATTPSSCSIPKLIPIKAGDTLLFGRNKDADIYLDSTLVANMISRTHAKVVSDGATGRVTVFDLNSTNGVYVNDRKIDVQQLSRGDRITFGGRGKSVKVGSVDPQPNSEFIYEFQCDAAEGEGDDGDDDEESSAFELLKELTDHIQLIITWITTAVLVGSYLFAEEGSQEFSFASDYVAPIFALIHVPFTRATFTLAFVLGVGLLLAGGMFIVQSTKGKGKGKGKKAKKVQ